MKRVLLTAVLMTGGAALAADPLPTENAGRRLRETEERRAAAAGAPATKAEVERLRKQVSVLMEEVAALQKVVRELQKAPAGDRGTGLRGDASAEIKKAIKESRIVLGMTLADANKAMDRVGTLAREDSIEQVYEWDFSSVRISATFQGGMVTDHSRQEKTRPRSVAPSGTYSPFGAGQL